MAPAVGMVAGTGVCGRWWLALVWLALGCGPGVAEPRRSACLRISDFKISDLRDYRCARFVLTKKPRHQSPDLCKSGHDAGQAKRRPRFTSSLRRCSDDGGRKTDDSRKLVAATRRF